jgi:hypothetical protein
MINEISASQRYSVTGTVKAADRSAKTDGTSQTDQSSKTDTVELGSRQETSVVYSKITNKKLSETDIAKLQAQADATTENLRRLVQELILKQSKSAQASSEDSSTDILSSLGITTEDIDAAKQAISDDGDFGVKAVSDRLVDFAIAVSGGDKSKLSELTSAIDKGFSAAKKALGGKLPDISQQTYDETMRKLNEWASSESDV